MPKLVGSIRTFAIPGGGRALLAAAFLGMGLGGVTLRGQSEIAAVKARADQGDPDAMNALATAYANGHGVPQDLAEAIRLYQRAADRGLAPAYFNLGMMHELGRGVAADVASAFKFYLKAAELGLAPAQFNVGNMYANGVGVAQDFFEAGLWFRQAAERGIPEAQYNLALAYELGRGVAKDEPGAQRWYRLAAGQGYTRAQYNLALMLEEGRGSPIDLTGAAEFYRAAALQNYAPAQNNLGILYAEGRGVPVNLVDAYTWLAIAVENGARTTGRDLVAQQLSSGQLGEANIGIAKLRTQLGLRDSAQANVVASAAPTSRPVVIPGPTPVGVPPPEVATATQVDLERLQAENVRLAESARALAREKSALEQRLAAAQTAKAPAPANAVALNTLRAQVEQLAREKAEAQRQAEELTVQLTTAREGGASGATAIGDPGAISALSLPQLAAADSRIAKLVTENARMNEDVKRSTIELGQLGRQLRAAQEKLSALEKDGSPTAGTSGADAVRTTELTRQLEEVRATNVKITAENQRLNRAAANPAETERVSTQLTTAQADLARLQAENGRLRQGAAATDASAALQRPTQAEQSLVDVTLQRDALATEKTALERRVAEASSRSATDLNAVQLLRTQLAAAGKAATEAGAEHQRLITQVAELQRTAQAQASDRGTIEQLRTQLADAQTRLTAAQQGRAAGAEAVQRLGEVTTRLAAVTAERDRLQSTHEAAGIDREMRQKLNAQVEDAGRIISELNAQNDSLQKDLEVAKQSTAAALAAQATAAKAGPSDAVKLELQTLQNQVRSVETQMEEDRKNSAQEISALASQLQSARESARALADANRALLQARGSEDATVKAEVDELGARLKATQSDLERTRTEQSRLVTELEARNRELDTARTAARTPAQERDALRSQVEEMMGQLSETERRSAQLRQTAETAKAEAEKAARQHGARALELTGLNEKLSSERVGLENQLTQLRKSSELALSELNELKSRAGNSDRVTREHLTTINGLGEANQKLQIQLSELGAKVTAMQAENTRLSTAGESVSNMRGELAEVRTKFTEAQKTAEQNAAVVAELTGANDKLTGELKSLQGQLATLREANTRLTGSDEARRAAEQRAESLTAAATQLAAAQRELAASRAEATRLNETVQAVERDRGARISQLQADNAAINARLRLAQGTLDQIASAARLINGGGAPIEMVVAAPTGGSTNPITPASSASAPVRTHIVAEGESLTRISARYYGTSSRWQEIYEANREGLRGENTLRPGQRLRIP